MITIAIMAGVTVVKWLIYTGLIWVMIKLQKMQYNMLGLFASTALATGLQFVPVAGCYLSWAALVYCLWKVTRADIAPEVLFTVAIPGAIMFCLNLWVFGSSLIVMSIVGGGLMPMFMGWLADVASMRFGFLMPLICFVVIFLYGSFWKALEDKDTTAKGETTAVPVH